MEIHPLPARAASDGGGGPSPFVRNAVSPRLPGIFTRGAPLGLPKKAPRFSGRFGEDYFSAGAAALASAAALAFSAWAFLMALYFSFSSAVATGRMASLGQTLVQSLQPTHLS